MKILKYPLSLSEFQVVQIKGKPLGLLSLQNQHGVPCAWFGVDDSVEGHFEVSFKMYTTGVELPESLLLSRFAGTVQIHNGVYHFFMS